MPTSADRTPTHVAGGEPARDLFAPGGPLQFGTLADHSLIARLFDQTRRGGSADRFPNRIDEPSYRPSDRLVLRQKGSIAGHVHVARHIAWFEGQRTTLARLEDFVLLPEYAQSPSADDLLKAAEGVALREGAVAAIVRGEDQEWLASRGWSPLRGQGHTRADATEVLAHLDAQESARRAARRTSLSVRTWRHFELDDVVGIYAQAAPGLWGAVCRSEAYWQWLAGASAHDEFLLAVERRRPAEGSSGSSEPAERIVGYAAVRGACIVEMMTLPGYWRARILLLARACRDAIDRGRHSVALYTPAADPLHELLVTAGGQWIDAAASGEPLWMIRLLAADKWVERMYPVWQSRAREGDVPRPLHLEFAAGQERRQFTLTRRSSRWEHAAHASSGAVVRATAAVRDALLLENLAIRGAVKRGQLQSTPEELTETLVALFPPRLFWQSPLDLQGA